MATWPFLIFVNVTWFLWAMVTVIQKEVEDRQNQVPEDQHRGTTILPIIPLFPLLICGLAILGDWVFSTVWVTRVVAILHTIKLVIVLYFIALGLWRLRFLK